MIISQCSQWQPDYRSTRRRWNVATLSAQFLSGTQCIGINVSKIQSEKYRLYSVFRSILTCLMIWGGIRHLLLRSEQWGRVYYDYWHAGSTV